MPFVLTVDQRGSRRAADRVPGAFTALSGIPTVLRFERTAGDAQAVLTALAALVERRSAQAWEAIERVEAGRTQVEAATELGVTRQAVGQRLAAGNWEIERDLRPVAVRLLTRAAG